MRLDHKITRAKGTSSAAAHHEHELVAMREHIQQPHNVWVLQAARAFNLCAHASPVSARLRPLLLPGTAATAGYPRALQQRCAAAIQGRKHGIGGG